MERLKAVRANDGGEDGEKMKRDVARGDDET